jgi:hypothetical protein
MRWLHFSAALGRGANLKPTTAPTTPFNRRRARTRLARRRSIGPRFLLRKKSRTISSRQAARRSKAASGTGKVEGAAIVDRHAVCHAAGSVQRLRRSAELRRHVNAGYVAEEIETKIVAARPAAELRLQQRAELIRRLLITPAQHSREIGLGPPA